MSQSASMLSVCTYTSGKCEIIAAYWCIAVMDLRKIGIGLFTMLWSRLLTIQWHIIQTRKAIGRRWWARPVNRRRFDQGFNFNLFRELSISDHEEFFGYTRMWLEQFEFLLNLVHPYLEKRNIRTLLSPRLRLSLTLT